MSHHVTQNFFWSELIGNKDSDDLPVLTRYLLLRLAEDVLQPLRNFFGCKIRVTNCLRWPSDYYVLLSRGWNPSLTSDHYAGLAVPTTTPEHKKRFGAYYTQSVGAADIVPECGVEKAWDAMRDVAGCNGAEIMAHKSRIVCGQVIYERSGTSEWLHVSNPPSVVFSNEWVNLTFHRRPWLKSVDGGNTYQEV